MFNLVVLTGRLTADPELKTTPNGIPVTTFSIAVNRSYRAGEEQQTDFINIVAWRQRAEFISKYFHKGSSLCIVGNIQTRSWQDQNGQKRFATDVIADEVSFVDSRSESTAAQADQAGAYVPAAYTAPAAAPSFEDVQSDEDLPF